MVLNLSFFAIFVASIFPLHRNVMVRAFSTQGSFCTQTAPYTSLLLVKIDSIYKSPLYPLSTEKMAAEIEYEAKYIRNFKTPLANIMVANNKLTNFTCDKYDVALPFTVDNKGGALVILYDSLNTDWLQKLIDKYKLPRIDEAELVLADSELKVVNRRGCVISECNKVKLYSDWLSTREYSFDVINVEYKKAIKQKEDLSVKIEVKNISKVAFPPAKYAELQIVKVSGTGIYDSSWKAPTVVGTINKKDSFWAAGDVLDYTFTLGKFLVPGKYEARFVLKYGSKRLKDTEFLVKFEVKISGVKLGEIRPRQGDIANVRSAPGLSSKILFTLHRGDIVIWHRQEGAWVNIETVDGKKGWVYRPFVWPLE